MALGTKAVKDWMDRVKQDINAQRALVGLDPLSFSMKDHGTSISIFATHGTRKQLCGTIDIVHGVVTDRSNGPIGSAQWSVIMPDVSGAIAT